MKQFSCAAAVALLCLAAGLSAPLHAIAPHSDQAHPGAAMPQYRATADALDVNPSLLMQAQRDFSLHGRIAPFLQRHGSEWELRWDTRGDRAAVVQGQGIALIPGRGNQLRSVDFQLSGDMSTDLPKVADKARAFIESVPELLGTDRLELKLDPERSTGFGANNERWFLEFQQFHDGVPVDGAFIYVRIVHGNVVQFGAERIGEIALNTQLAGLASAASLFASVWNVLAFPNGSEVSEVLSDGELRIYPLLPSGQFLATEHSGLRGAGYEHVLARRYVFRVDEHATWQVLVDARSGEVIDLRDLTLHVDATVSGGVYPNTNTDPQLMVDFPFTAVTNNGNKITNIDGVYDYTGGNATVTLDGQYFRMADNCGAISLSNNTTGNLDLGSSGGTDCTTPGFGGAGNTHSSRTGFYHLTLINTKARSLLPANTWLQGKVTANMNINNQCNATWNGSAVNFYRSGGGCSNTGEIAAVFLHEWGHGMDTNTGGAASENASGEAVGDIFAFLETRDSCIGPNFRPGIPCHNCTSCTGVRDMADFALGGARTLATPANVAAAGGLNCGRFSCPYSTPQGFPYRGPMGYQGHCESHIASTASWDLKSTLVDEFGESGWQRMDNIWYGSLVPSKSAYQVASGGTCNPSAIVNGCGATNWYTVFLAADDDDGNLANGTPNACRIWDAFDTHGIACGARPACTEFPTPDFSLSSAQPSQQVCAGEVAEFPITVGELYGFTNPVTLALAGQPVESSPSFAVNPVAPGNATTLSISNTAAVGSGIWPLVVSGSAADSGGHDLALSLRVDSETTAAPTLQSPPQQAPNVALAPVMQWQALPDATLYSIEVALDPDFQNIVAEQTGIGASAWQAPTLQANTQYYWRVRTLNGCGSSPWSTVSSFTTAALFCSAPNVAIPDNNPTGVTSVLNIPTTGTIESMRLSIRANHTWVGDLAFRLNHAGGEAMVIDRPGVPASQFGCSNDHIDVVLDDEATSPVENACAPSPPTISGALRPNTLMGPVFGGMELAGDWSLTATDAYQGDTGTLLEWCIEPVLSVDTYSVSGDVTGLLGSGLALSLNGGPELAIAADGAFSFADTLFDGANYVVTVATQPTLPTQDCEVLGGSGQINGADIDSVSVMCESPTYSVGGEVQGLLGSGLTLSLNAGAALAIGGDGSFQFDAELLEGQMFEVEILNQPQSPGQTCSLENGTGTVGAGNVMNLVVDCVSNSFSVGGTVTGLVGSGLSLSLNGGAALDIDANGSFTFPAPLEDGANYAVSVLSQPSFPTQLCELESASGQLNGADVDTVEVSCSAPTYQVGGQVVGLQGSGLMLSLNDGEPISVEADGPFQFADTLLEGETYSVAVMAQPQDPAQVCSAMDASGTAAIGNIIDVQMLCFGLDIFSDDFE